MGKLPPLQHQAVRDLAWVCLSPPLLNALPGSKAGIIAGLQNDSAVLSWLSAQDQQPQQLNQHLSLLKSPRLGIYYEALCAYIWQHYPGRQLRCKNLQVSDNGKTFGEYDLIGQSATGLYHIEVAVKFYLGLSEKDNEANSHWQQWLGPNCNDRLDKKLHRLRDHQLPLSRTTQGIAALQQQGIPAQQLHSRLQLQGYLFYPAHSALATPVHSHSQHLRGLWYYQRDFIKLLKQQANSHWLELDKPLWLSPAVLYQEHSPAPLNSEAMAQSINDYFTNTINPQHKSQKQRPLLLAQMQQQPQRWQEQQRCFVVPDYWPWGKT
ncbi:DUF1853 family protein [Dasania marina]|uniref:DUF1853 family protein n=1 Tax=Dasania marina TaxID=471499 RepID=UPI0030DD5415|tara:strand:+ start:16657 stop:17622 length:966 start_codon:yes stop_codon:yes gene_type:complete